MLRIAYKFHEGKNQVSLSSLELLACLCLCLVHNILFNVEYVERLRKIAFGNWHFISKLIRLAKVDSMNIECVHMLPTMPQSSWGEERK